ncbi:GerAB/ArcD/ProY family transporter [Shouchella clausii]|uniref:GerAB/ArcD/ProY family transporter n=1 Tax=Shouchella clausii TaxID=79880 RepID=UPI003461A31B
MPEPFLYLIKSFSFPIVERIDLIFLCLWSVIVITTYGIYVYCGVIGTMTLFRSQRYHLYIVLAFLITFLVNLMPDSMYQVRQMITRTDEFGTIMNAAIPLLMLLIAIVFKRRSKV